MNKNSNLTVVMYHYVRDFKNSRYPEIKGCDVRLFKEQIGYIKKHYSPVTVEEVVDAYNNGRGLPDHAILLTFDDAYADHFNYAFPILEHEHIQGVFFPPVKAVLEHKVLDVNKIHFILASTPSIQMPQLLKELRLMIEEYSKEYQLESFDYYYEKYAIANRFDSKDVIFVKRLLQVALPEALREKVSSALFEKAIDMDEAMFSRELYMSIDQLKCMVDCGMHIGSHGYNHYWLGSLSREKQEFEVLKSIDFIRTIGGDPTRWTMGYPYGDYNQDTIDLLRSNGCCAAFTTEVGIANLSKESPDAIYKLARLDVNDLPKAADAPVNHWY